ncbi:acetoacetate--CoA ligase [Pelagibacteraceae bacterium]|nr:acetoacetate--CoA ligase [Pelagibacteraceae bacterium]
MENLWTPSKNLKNKSNLFKFEKFISKKYKINFNLNYKKILKWSIKNSPDFWDSIWDFCKVKGIKGKKKIVKSKIFYKNNFFPDHKLNFAENLLSKNNSSKAITFISENGFKEIKTWKNLNDDTNKLIQLFKKLKIKTKDRVAGYMPNTIENVEGFLASTAIGAIWSSCSPDFGIKGVIERFSQIKPKVLLVTDRYYYNGKEINILERIPELLKKVKSIKHVLICKYPGTKYLKNDLLVRNVSFLKWNEKNKFSIKKIKYKKFDFNHELAILYSSGTTGKPKCICHRSGGTLIQHLKEHQLHCDIKENDNIFYFTTCGWMMWNWLISALASKASIVLFDGFPMYKKKDLLFRLAKKEKITLLGISAKLIDNFKKEKISIIKKYKLGNLKTICSTGSPLSRDGFKYIYKHIKKNVHLASISGGTDIISCFVLGNVYEPVIAGEIQNKGLGMDVLVLNKKGISIKKSKGELICNNSFPSMPLKFWNDKKDIKYKKAYFQKFKNLWHHGDYAEITKNGGFIIYGRSDATLNPGGVRLGTSEIYSVVDKFYEIKESIVIGQKWDNDIRIVLFVVLKTKVELTESLKIKIKKKIKQEASPRHVPTKIISVLDVPRTKNGKIVELAIKNLIDGNEINNIEALANPEVLSQFKNLKELSY